VTEKKTRTKRAKDTEKKVTRYTYENIKEPRTPETGHTSLLPSDEQVVTLPMDNGWSKAIQVGKLSAADARAVVVDMDPVTDPVLFWAGKRNRREVPVLPLQRNEIVTESRVSQIVERARKAAEEKSGAMRQGHLYADLEKTLREGDRSRRVEFYTHEEGWKNKLICGDSLHVMESLLHYENLRGKVQMVYMDPPYGIKYDSNFQQRIDTTANDEKDQGDDVLTIKAFRDTWLLGPHSYLQYLAERLYLCRELLATSGSMFVQINDVNLHLVFQVAAEVFGARNFVSLIAFYKTSSHESGTLSSVCDYLVWFARDKEMLQQNELLLRKEPGQRGAKQYTKKISPDLSVIEPLNDEEIRDVSRVPAGWAVCRLGPTTSPGFSKERTKTFHAFGRDFHPGSNRHWSLGETEMRRLIDMGRIRPSGNGLATILLLADNPVTALDNIWMDTGTGSFTEPQVFVVQTAEKVVSRSILLSTRPGDLVFDPTCGSGTTATCAERWGRRWVTCDTSRVATNVARKRLLGTVFPHYTPVNGGPSSGFKYGTVRHVTMDALAKGMEAETLDLLSEPIVDPSAIRVCGPFEVMSLGRYSIEDWKGYVVRDSPDADGESAKLENYLDVICRLYRKDAAIQGANGLVHAVAETGQIKIAISVGPLSGRVTAKQINDAVQDALASGILEVHVLGWAFEANVGEVKSQLEKRGRVKIELVMIRPDTLDEGLKITQAEMLFSPLALPDLDVSTRKDNGEHVVTAMLRGVAVFDRKTRGTDYKSADSGYVSAWYLDEDYDGDCFVDCQMFFDFKKVPNLKATLNVDIDTKEFKLQTISRPFPVRGYKRIAVKVVDIFGNESTVVKDIG
jgi:adenine-specific DNA-methyltransferase